MLDRGLEHQASGDFGHFAKRELEPFGRAIGSPLMRGGVKGIRGIPFSQAATLKSSKDRARAPTRSAASSATVECLPLFPASSPY